MSCLRPDLMGADSGLISAQVILVKRYPEPMARRPVSRHPRVEAVDTGCQRDIPVL